MATELKNYAQTVLDQASDGHNYHWVDEYNGRPYEPMLISHDNHCGAVFLISPRRFC